MTYEENLNHKIQDTIDSMAVLAERLEFSAAQVLAYSREPLYSWPAVYKLGTGIIRHEEATARQFMELSRVVNNEGSNAQHQQLMAIAARVGTVFTRVYRFLGITTANEEEAFARPIDSLLN